MEAGLAFLVSYGGSRSSRTLRTDCLEGQPERQLHLAVGAETDSSPDGLSQHPERPGRRCGERLSRLHTVGLCRILAGGRQRVGQRGRRVGEVGLVEEVEDFEPELGVRSKAAED